MLARRVQVDASTAAAAFSSTAAKKPPPSSACCPTLSAQPSRFELDTTDLFTDVYITNSNQDTKQFNGPNYDNSGIKPVQNSSKTWEQLQIEKSLNK
jgi:hypothetical protein